jgi:hypothetical protein
MGNTWSNYVVLDPVANTPPGLARYFYVFQQHKKLMGIEELCTRIRKRMEGN